jgi:hypothetical protein
MFRDGPNITQSEPLESGMLDMLNAAELRRLAMECAGRAGGADCAPDERARLLTMREALLDLAANADWLAGRPIMDAARQSASATQQEASARC